MTSISGYGESFGRYFIYDYYYVPKHNYYILLYIIINTTPSHYKYWKLGHEKEAKLQNNWSTMDESAVSTVNI